MILLYILEGMGKMLRLCRFFDGQQGVLEDIKETSFET
jgi:hypothetical protein